MAELQSDKNNPVSSLIWGLVVAGLGVYQLTKHRDGPVPTLAKFFGMLSIVGGALLVLAAIAMLWAKRFVAATAQKTHELNRAIYAGVHEHELVGPEAIAAMGLDTGFYDQMASELRPLGFTHYIDYVDVTLRNAMPNSSAVIRAFTSENGNAMCAAYHFTMTSMKKVMQSRVVEMETELSDGTFVTTSTSAAAGKTNEFPGIDRRHVAEDTRPEELLTAHEAHVATIMSTRVGTSVAPVHGFAELKASQDRQQMLKVQYRNSASFDPAVEIRRIAGKPLNETQEDYAAETARLHREEAK